ncbi:hypothetical protein SETIT_5G205200v2 [Setaria italica]|uniref:Uncharacterized protein n=1 Tax=Setaria italica TaxID=4555 RepID=A0A368R731_SETIT|nr:hypothetical protein SETIT_5G205200v2 [Setaria italica]
MKESRMGTRHICSEVCGGNFDVITDTVEGSFVPKDDVILSYAYLIQGSMDLRSGDFLCVICSSGSRTGISCFDINDLILIHDGCLPRFCYHACCASRTPFRSLSTVWPLSLPSFTIYCFQLKQLSKFASKSGSSSCLSSGF